MEESVINHFLENNLYEDYKKVLLNHTCTFLKSRLDLIDIRYKSEFYNKLKALFEKINNKYDLASDMNLLLSEKNLIFNQSILGCENYDQFISEKNENDVKSVESK